MGLIKPATSGHDRREEQQRQQKQQEHLQNLAAAIEENVDTDFVERVTSTDLNVNTVRMLDNMLTSDWVLANFEDAEVHEARWLVRVMEDQLEALHPAEDSIWQGEYRQYAADDSRQDLEPLNSAQRLEISELLLGVISRATRSRDGWQQENFNKTHRVSETIDHDEEESGGFLP